MVSAAFARRSVFHWRCSSGSVGCHLPGGALQSTAGGTPWISASTYAKRVVQVRDQHVTAAGSLGPARFSPRRSDVSEASMDPLPLDNAQAAFGSESSIDLVRHALLLTALRIPGVAARSEDMLRLSYGLLGRSATNWLLRATIFHQFCGGETLKQLQGTAEKLAERNLGCIIDYAAERDVSADDRASSCEFATDWAASYRECKTNAISMAALLPRPSSNSPPFVAIKVSGFTSFDTLRRLTVTINFAHNLFDAIVSGFSTEALARMPPVLQSSTHHERLSEAPPVPVSALREWLRAAWPNLNEPACGSAPYEPLLRHAEAVATDGALDFHVWREQVFTPQMLAQLPPPCGIRAELWPISGTHDIELQKLYDALQQITEHAARLGVRLLYDAEQAFVQPVIDCLVQVLQEKFNRDINTGALVYNTYQMYLKEGLGRLKCDCRRAESQGYMFGIKLVRGAYMVHESRMSMEMQYDSPVANSIEDTHYNYDAAVEFLLNRTIPNELLCGTHNEQSVQMAVLSLLARKASSGGHACLAQDDSSRRISRVTFAQLLGMSDHISVQLAARGFPTYKYVPFGPVDDVLPYLVRRAQENSSLIGGSAKECRMMWLELRRRCTSLLS